MMDAKTHAAILVAMHLTKGATELVRQIEILEERHAVQHEILNIAKQVYHQSLGENRDQANV